MSVGGHPLRFGASLLVSDERLTPTADFLLGWLTFGFARWMLKNLEGRQEGLWVGGELVLTSNGVEFHANTPNRLVNQNGLDVDIPATAIMDIMTRRRRFGAGVVEFQTADRTVSIMCWRPNKVSALARELFSIPNGSKPAAAPSAPG